MIDFSAIPKQMQDIRAWLLWHKFPQQDGTLKKVPDEFSRNGKNWKTIEPLTFTSAKMLLEMNKGESDGIGIAFTEQNEVIGIDIDDAIKPDGEFNMKIMEKIFTVLKQAQADGCYIETSISGTGYHVYGYSTIKDQLISLFGDKIVSKNVEVYFKDSYFTVSGNCYSGFQSWGCIDNAIREAYKIIVKENPSIAQNKAPTTATSPQDDKTPVQQKEAPITKNITPSASVPDGGYTDEEVLKLPLAPVNTVMYIMGKDTKKNGAEAAHALIAGYPEGVNRSEYDEKIIGVLCYWLYRYGVGTICDVFQKSKLYRPHDAADKNDRKGKFYLENSVEKAYNNAQKFFPAADYKKMSDAQKNKLKIWIKRKERE